MLMRGSKVSGLQSRKRTYCGKTCKANGNAVYIDVESYTYENTIVIDEPESSTQKLRRCNVQKEDKKFPSEGVISIDDDEGNDVDHMASGEMDSDATSSKRSVLSSGDEYCVIRGKNSASKLPNSKQTSSGKAPCRNRYGLDTESNDSFDSDCSDCVMEDSFGKARELWEKASQKRKYGVHNGQSGLKDQGSASGSYSDFPPGSKVENMAKQHRETPSHSDLNNRNFEKVESFSFTAAEDDGQHHTSLNSRWENPSFNPARFLSGKFGPTENIQSSRRKDDAGPSSSQGKHAFPKAKRTPTIYFNSSNADHQDKDYLSCKAKQSADAHVNPEEELLQDQFAPKETDDESHLEQAKESNVTISFQGDIINYREKVKETDEYKRVMKEEWAARQKQLQIQAEEAQRLRRRLKAENERALDMERRQKQRVEEMRDTQKKIEENRNTKEQFRMEIREELSKLEMTCNDLVSLLRGLGIDVGGVFFPSSSEIHAAYKRALLRFHPDRASRLDIRQQVEAEEKFKLISRMKEKFPFPLA